MAAHAKSILGYHRSVELSPTMVMEIYAYVYIANFDAARDREFYGKAPKRGWEEKCRDREIVKTKQGHLWIYRTIWQKKKK